MGDILRLLVAGPQLLYVALLAALCALLQTFMQYRRLVFYLRWLCLALFAYFGTVLIVHVPWAEIGWGFVLTFSGDAAFWAIVVAIMGTTISPYLFFWPASQGAEDIKALSRRFHRIRLDTYIGMDLQNLVGLAIIIMTS